MEAHSCLLDRIAQLPSLQLALLLLQYCAAQRFTYLARTVPPSHSLAGAEIHDHRIRTTLARLLSVDNLSDSHWQQATLRIAEGGLGLGSAQRDRFAAYLGSAADCIRHFVSAFPLLHTLVDTWMDEHSTLPVSADLE